MADIGQSLIIFGQLIGLLDKNGAPQWTWFGDPKTQILGKSGDTTVGMAANREFVGKFIRSLTGGNPDDADAAFAAGYSWVPLNDGDKVEVGFVWSSSGPTLQIGLGAQANLTVSGDPVNLAVLAKLLTIGNGAVTPNITDVMFSGTLPAPDFLKSIEIDGDTVPPSITANITNKQTGADAARKLIYSGTTQPSVFAWDCARIALFVLEAWIHDKASAAAGVDNAFTRIDHHAFAMLGDPPSAIKEFPLVGADNMQKAPDFGLWRDSVLNLGSGATGALAFLWHLRALLTGNENQDFLTGSPSLFMPLTSGSLGGSAPTSIAQATGSYNPATVATAGVWIGIIDASPTFTLVLDIQSGTAGKFLRIQLAQLANGTLTRPIPPSAADLQTFLSALPANSPVQAGKSSDGFWTVSYVAQLTDATLPVFSGSYTFQAVMSNPVRFQVTSTQLPVTFIFPPESVPAPPTAQQLIGMLVNWIISAVPAGSGPSDPQTQLKNIAQDLANFVSAELKTSGTGNVGQLLLSIGEALGTGASFDTKTTPLDFKVSLAKGTTDAFFHVNPSVSYGPLTPDQIPDLPISIGNLFGSLDLAVDKPGNPLFGFSLGFDDFRLGVTQGDGSGGASDLISSLLPDLKQAPGFQFEFDWTVSGGVKISGGGKIPVQLTLGPLSLSQLLVDVSNSNLTIAVSLTFQLSFITVSTYELGMSFDFKTDTPSLVLQGLGLSFQGAGITLTGMFLNDSGDYVGGAAVDIEDMFSLTAIGGYKKLAGGQASLFIFASLMAPLGGPPFFFVTGIAGGFGYNRTLPPVTLMGNHPFFKIMSGQIPLSSDPKQGIGTLLDPNTGFAPKLGDYWIAAGLQFTSFAFINGKVIVAVAFGHDFSIDVLGMASFSLGPVAYFEIDIVVTVDSEKFLLIAGMSPSSYLIHPDIFNMSGDFGLGAWHSGVHQGDFLLSIGGYHPYFHKPDYYPELARVPVKANVFGFVHLSIECFFACTPQALMAGASVSLSATFAGIGAGLDVYIDVFIQWDPFFILATMGVDLWFEFLGRHDIGVDLTIQTPPFGGLAHISLFIVSFDVSFGASLGQTPPAITVEDFFTRHLNVPATASQLANDANVALFNTASAAGLMRIVFTSGKTIAEQADTQKAQEGTASPVQVAPEFSFLLRTRLPFNTSGAASAHMTGKIDLPLCGFADLDTELTVTLVNDSEAHAAVPIPVADISVTTGMYPLANFGGTPMVAQGGNDAARTAVSKIDTSKPAVLLHDGLQFNLQANPTPATQTTMAGPEEQLSDATENYPLPFGWPANVTPVFKMPKSALSYLTSAAASAAITKNAAQIQPQLIADFIDLRLPLILDREVIAAPQIVTTSAPVTRRVRTAAAQVSSVAAPPAGVVTMAPPASPLRRIELAPVTLRILPTRTPTPTAPPPLRILDIARSVAVRSVLTAPLALAVAAPLPAAPTPTVAATPAAPPPPPKPSVTVVSGNAVHLEISSSQAPAGSLVFAGQQTVRAVFMTAFGETVADQFVTGSQTVPLPPRSRNVLLVGEGVLAGAPASLGNLGVEPGTSLYAIGSKDFAGYGCVARSNAPLLQAIAPGQTLTGADILPASGHFTFYFPPAPKGSSLLITMIPALANAAPVASQVRWRATGATLSGLNTAASQRNGALLMDAQSTVPWSLDIDLTVEWRLAGVVVCTQSSADVLAHLQTNSNWTFIDDHFLPPPSPMSTTVTLEITNG
jgi:hypothetical protein